MPRDAHGFRDGAGRCVINNAQKPLLLDQIRQALSEERNYIHQDDIQRIIQTTRHCCSVCLDARGGNTTFLPFKTKARVN